MDGRLSSASNLRQNRQFCVEPRVRRPTDTKWIMVRVSGKTKTRDYLLTHKRQRPNNANDISHPPSTYPIQALDSHTLKRHNIVSNKCDPNYLSLSPECGHFDSNVKRCEPHTGYRSVLNQMDDHRFTANKCTKAIARRLLANQWNWMRIGREEKKSGQRAKVTKVIVIVSRIEINRRNVVAELIVQVACVSSARI